MQKIVLITGATSGFGEACAYKFAANGYRLIIAGRRRDRLEKLATILKEKYDTPIIILNLDVRHREEVIQAINDLPDAWREIDILINNAGLALGRDNFAVASLDDWDTMVDTNIKGAAYVAQTVAKLMITRQQGHIINIGSIAAKEVYENGNMYCTTKHALDALSQAMRIDLLPYNIRVTAIHPGAANTEFSLIRFKGNKQTADQVYDGMKPLIATDIAEIVYYTATLPEHICINDLVVTCTQQANSFYTHKN